MAFEISLLFKIVDKAYQNNRSIDDNPSKPNDADQLEQKEAEPAHEKKASPDPDDATARANPYESLRYTIVRNDGKPESMIKLVGLKSLFAKQLPKMPRAYIARLVFDRRHTSLAILSDNPELEDSDEEIIGGICYRAFPEMRFAGKETTSALSPKESIHTTPRH